MPVTNRTFNDQELANILVGVCEGSGASWFCARIPRNSPKINDTYTTANIYLDDEEEENSEYLKNGYALAEGKMYVSINLETMKQGIELILNGTVETSDRIKQDILEDNMDADTYDCIIQAAIFNEIIFS
jgi:hypothetical protein